MFWFFSYSIGVFLGIQIGKKHNPSYIYLMNKYSTVNTEYYKNNQMNYRFNK
jgi:hypothetical protein